MAEDGPGDELPHLLAFYLPQFHQVPDNDAWHGSGFTEWTVVARAEPLFPGHHQPHLPGELGFYDLRVPETRERQANLARRHGISGFLYYHYWFGGRRMLERPFDEVLHSGAPDFPFALCWANESWYRRWQGSSDEMLVEQNFDQEDDLAHIRWLIEAFKDPRYITIHGRPLLTIYRPDLLPEPKVTFDLWREECANAGVRDPWLVMFETGRYAGDPTHLGFDASAEFVPHGMWRDGRTGRPPPRSRCQPLRVLLRRGGHGLPAAAPARLDPIPVCGLRMGQHPPATAAGRRSSSTARTLIPTGGGWTQPCAARAAPTVVTGSSS